MASIPMFTPMAPLATRILSLSGFPPELKTRDIQAVFSQWENDRGGFKIKWVNDTNALVIFNDPSTGELELSASKTCQHFSSLTSLMLRPLSQPKEHTSIPSCPQQLP